MREQVVVTGFGAVTPLGLDAAASLEAVFAGRSAIDHITSFDTSGLSVTIGGEVRGFDPSPLISSTDLRRLDEHAQYAIAAGAEALAAAIPGLAVGAAAGEAAGLPFDPARMGVIVGTSAGATTQIQASTRVLDAQGPARVRPGVAVYGGADAGAAYLSTRFGIEGPSHGVSATCASGAMAIGEAMRLIRHGYLDAVLVTSGEHCVNRLNFAANANMRGLTAAYADDPRAASRPFDRARSGFVMSAGGAALMLESERFARLRGALVLGRVLGYGATSDAFHATAPHPEGAGAARAMRLALIDAGLAPEEIDHVSAHATSTPKGDLSEVLALRQVFGEAVAPVTATKSVSGHLIGVSGAFEALVTLAALTRQAVPPTLNLDDPEFDLDVVTGAARPLEMTYALSNSFGFGGHNASLVLGAATKSV